MATALACGGTSPSAPTSPSAAVTATAPPSRRIVVLGDSLAVSPSKASGFPAVIQQRLDARHPGWIVANEGIFGDTTAGGLQRLDGALTADAAILVLELGANDGLRGTPIATIEGNLSTMIQRARARGLKVLLCGMETPPLNGLSYTLDYHQLYPRLAARYDIPLVPFLLDGVALNPELSGADGIHPNAAGARRIGETVWTYLEPMVMSAATAASR